MIDQAFEYRVSSLLAVSKLTTVLGTMPHFDFGNGHIKAR